MHLVYPLNKMPTVASNYRFARRNGIEREKLAINRVVARLLQPKMVLDVFAGDGTSSRIFAKHSDQVMAIEKDQHQFQSLFKSSRTRRLVTARSDNLKLLPLLKAGMFDLIDFDPYGSCYPQLAYAARLLSSQGAVLITSGEVQRVVRGLELRYLPDSRHYRGRQAAMWAEAVWIPFLLNVLNDGPHTVEVIHFFTSPVLSRAVLGTAPAARRLQILSQRKRYFGWFDAITNRDHTP